MNVHFFGVVSERCITCEGEVLQHTASSRNRATLSFDLFSYSTW
jgi:hypothetical protein